MYGRCTHDGFGKLARNVALNAGSHPMARVHDIHVSTHTLSTHLYLGVLHPVVWCVKLVHQVVLIIEVP
jgi:hypothetical protein